MSLHILQHDCRALSVSMLMLYCDREQKWSEARTDGIWEALLACVCLSARGYQENFCWRVPRVCEKESKEGDTLSRYPGAGTIHGAAGLAESLEARGHPSGASRADHALLLPYRPQDVWQGQGTDGGVFVSMLSPTWFLDMSSASARYINVLTRERMLDWHVFLTLKHMHHATTHADCPLKITLSKRTN